MALFDVKWFKDTDITASELEQLTDGSNADSLHTHLSQNYVFDCYDSTGGQTFTTTPVTINLDTERINTDSTIFVLNTDDSVTINTDGLFLFIARVSTDISSGTTRSTSRIWLEVSNNGGSTWISIPGTYAYMYNRTVNVADDTGIINCVLNVSSGDRFRIRAERVDGSSTITTQSEGTGLTVCSLQGMKGEKGDPGNIDLACVQVRNTNDYSISTSYVTVPFDTKDIENDNTILEGDLTNNRIIAHQSGYYRIYYNYNINPGTGTVRVDGRVVLNGSTVIPGSYSYVEVYGGETHELCQSCIVYLNENDYIEYQLQAASTTNATADSVFNVHKLEGAQGEQGPQGPPGPGSTITVYDSGSLVDTSASILDFYDINVVNLGGGHIELRHPEPNSVVFQARSQTGTDINVTTPVAIQWDITDFVNTTYFRINPFDTTRVDILQDGLYQINYNVTTQNSDTNRKTIRCRIRINGSTYLDVGEAYGYTRNTTDDLLSISPGPFIFKFSSGDYLHLMADRQGSSGSAYIVKDKPFIYIYKLD